MFDPSTATVFSICPFPVTAHKPGLTPGHFNIASCTDVTKPEILKINSATFPVYLDADRGSMRVSCSAHDVARSIVEDYCTSSLGVSDDARPGLFFIDGTKEKVDISTVHLLEKAKKLQQNWFMNLIKIADDEWQKTHRHAAISGMQRVAFQEINKLRELSNEKPLVREWFIIPVSDEVVEQVVCPACGAVIVNDPILCPTCKLVRKPEEYKKLQFAGAK